MKIKTKLKHSVALGLAALCLSIILFSLGFFQTFDNQLQDALFKEQSPLPFITIVTIDDKSLQEVGRWPWDRAVYVEALNHMSNAKAIGLDVAFFEVSDIATDTELGNLMQTLPIVMPSEYDVRQKEFLYPPKTYEGVNTGYVNVFADSDGIIRNQPLTFEGEKSFALKIYETFIVSNATLTQNPLRINYIGGPFSFETVSFSNAANYDFKNKLVLIGATAPDLHDSALVPTSNGLEMPGVEIHANAIQTLITKNYLNMLPTWSEVLIMIIFTIIITLSIVFLPLLYSTLISICLLFLYVAISLLLFEKGILMGMIYPPLIILLSYIFVVAGNYVMEITERQRVKNIFGKYVSPHLAQHILDTTHKEEINLEGEEKDVALLFADIRGFTSMSEKMTPREVVTMLNNYLGAMTTSVFDNNGTLDKYMGDCIMAIFGAPVSSKNPTLDAVKCAIDMQKLVNSVSKDLGIPKIDLGVGINFGEAIVGNMGSKQRVEYTAIGDTVNTASRMCSAAEGGEIKLPKESYELVKEFVNAKYVGKIKVKGKVKPIKVYEVKGLK